MSASSPRTRLASPFSAHAVLQADRPCPVWGWDAPGRSVRLQLIPQDSGETALECDAVADATGQFRFELPQRPASGPYRVVVDGSTRVTHDDIWFGEVWLASGQSNMEWKVASSRDARTEIENANFPRIRAFKVEPRAEQEPAPDAAGNWTVCSPRSVADFSAVAYFFAREIHAARGVAVGIIDATWGGTCIEAWLSLPALRPLSPGLDAERAELAAQLEQLPAYQEQYARTLSDWQRGHLPTDGENLGLGRGWAALEHDDAEFRPIALPTFWQSQGLNFNGVVWFRREVKLPLSFAGHELIVSLGAVDDFDDTYFDGELIGRTPPGSLDAHRTRRRYVVPKERVKAGRHVIAVRVFDHFGAGGFAGPSNEMYLESSARPGERISLEGPWRLRVEREIPLVPIAVFQTFPEPPACLAQQNTPAALFHGMVAPLCGYALRGAIWYQGESNVERHASYRAMLIALMRDYRTRWGQGQFPFYYVQLANYVAPASWPLLREAQAEAEAEPGAAMVVTIDVGDSNDIHPTNKQEVGRRLSLLARALSYGEAALEHRGPRLSRIEVAGERAWVELSSARGLRARGAEELRGFELAGADGQYHPAAAQIDGERVCLLTPRVPKPCAVRYAWAADPDANLENAAGLPAAPFRTDAGA